MKDILFSPEFLFFKIKLTDLCFQTRICYNNIGNAAGKILIFQEGNIMLLELMGLFGDYLLWVIFFLGMEYILYRCHKSRGIVPQRGFLIGWQVLACLLTGILSVTGAGALDDLLNARTSLELNLIPFHLGMSGIVGMVLNLILFVPLGLAVPLLWRRSGETLWRTAGLGFVLSLLIELSQLLNLRVTDADDLLMNTLGTAVGYGIYWLFLRKVRIFQLDNTQSESALVRHGAAVSVLAVFVFRFFIGEPLSAALLSMICGY